MSTRSLSLPFVEPVPAIRRRSAVRLVTPVVPQQEPPTRRKRRAAWLALHFEDLPLRAAVEKLAPSDRGAVDQQPFAVTNDDQCRTVAACNAIAAGFGIRAGHSLNAAIALCANTTFVPRQTPHETELLHAMARHCERYTPLVSVERPNELLLEVRGSFGLFGGVQALVNDVNRVFDSKGTPVRLALTSTAQSALWLSRAARTPAIVPPRQLIASIARLPVAALHWPMEVELRLTRFGVLTVGDLLRLPRGGLARRIGHGRLTELDQALGRQPQVRTVFRSDVRYRDQLVLDFEIETTKLLGDVVARRLERLEGFLTKRQLAIEHVVLDLKHREARTTSIIIGLASATANVAHVIKLVQERLTQTQLCAPVREVIIRVDRLRVAQGSSLPLFMSIATADSTTLRREQQAHLLEQFRARLGDDAVGRVIAAADYRPECAHAAPLANITPATSTSAVPASLAPRPFWLLAEPQSLALAASSHRPKHLLRGPELLDTGWWDGRRVVRAYFHARSPLGALAWVCRDRSAPQSWYLHGLFG